MWSKRYCRPTRSVEACDREEAPRNWGFLHLALWAATLTIIWFIVLPRLGQWTPIRQRITEQDAKGINPEALFYTDLDVMKSVLGKMNE